MISVVIPAHNEEENIEACLEALSRQSTRRRFEVILVDNASTDGTVAIAKKFRQKLSLRIITERKKGRGMARFRGFQEATGAVILSTDADAQVGEHWMDCLVETLERRPGTVAVTGVPRIADCGTFRNALFNFFVPKFLLLNYLFFGQPGLSGFSFAIRKNIYDRAGGFDPYTDAYEDLELSIRVHRLGRIVLTRREPILFSGRRFRNGLLRGWAEYVRTFFEKFIVGKRRVLLSDVK